MTVSENNTQNAETKLQNNDPFTIGSFTLDNRLIMGTGRFDSFDVMQQAIAASQTNCVTVAVRREKLHDSQGRNILEFIDLERTILLPNTAGCFDAQSAIRCAKMGREILLSLENPGAKWVKLEVLGDRTSLLPDPIELLNATEALVSEGFEVLCYSNDDPVVAKRLKNAGATSVMPAGSPIGSGMGIANPLNICMVIETLKNADPDYPVIVDAGVGTASDAAIAMELGADGVLLNTSVAQAKDPISMAKAMNMAVCAGRLAFKSGRMPKSKYAAASSPDFGVFTNK